MLDKINDIQKEIEKKDKMMGILNKRNTELERKIIEINHRSVLEIELDNANEGLAEDDCEQIDVQELDELSKRRFEHPSKYVDVIEIMRDRESEK